MVNEFGKFCRKLRIDRGELLADMAKKLEVTASYLSAVEVGKRAVPKEWLSILSEKYDLSSEEKKELQKAIDLSTNVVKFEIANKKQEDKEMLLKLARSFDNLSEETKRKMFEILKEE